MFKPYNRIQAALDAAHANLAAVDARIATRPQCVNALPGDVYVLPCGVNITVEWFVVRVHPDDATLVLVVPLDDFPLIGSDDIDVTGYRPTWRARCRFSVWIPRSICEPRLRTDCIPQELPKIRTRLADLARGRSSVATTSQQNVDDDIAYENWEFLLAIASSTIEDVKISAGQLVPYAS